MSEREDKIRKAWREIPKFLRSVPFETYRYEQLPLTGEWGWRASDGQAFRVSGHFVVDSDQDDIVLRGAPQESAEIWKAKHPGNFRDFLKEANGNEEDALRLLVEDENDWGGRYYTPPKFFDGRWLVISPSPQKGLSTKDRDYMYLEEIFEPASLEPPEIRVKGVVQAWSEEGLAVLKDLNRGETDTETQVIFDTPSIMIEWMQFYATPVFGKSKIYLTDCPQEDEKLYVPQNRGNNSLQLPRKSQNGLDSSAQDRRPTFAMDSRLKIDERRKTQLEDFAKKEDVFVGGRDFFDESGLLIAYHDKRGKITPLEEKQKYPRVYRP